MENKRRAKKVLIAKILTVSAVLLFIALFCIIIWQTVEISRLNSEISNLNETYQSETEAKEWAEQ